MPPSPPSPPSQFDRGPCASPPSPPHRRGRARRRRRRRRVTAVCAVEMLARVRRRAAGATSAVRQCRRRRSPPTPPARCRSARASRRSRAVAAGAEQGCVHRSSPSCAARSVGSRRCRVNSRRAPPSPLDRRRCRPDTGVAAVDPSSKDVAAPRQCPISDGRRRRASPPLAPGCGRRGSRAVADARSVRVAPPPLSSERPPSPITRPRYRRRRRGQSARPPLPMRPCRRLPAVDAAGDRRPLPIRPASPPLGTAMPPLPSDQAAVAAVDAPAPSPISRPPLLPGTTPLLISGVTTGDSAEQGYVPALEISDPVSPVTRGRQDQRRRAHEVETGSHGRLDRRHDRARRPS